MITITTIPLITKSQADAFNDEQELKKLTRINPISHNDCRWLLKVIKHHLLDGFSADIEWHQIQEYATGDPANPLGEKEVLIYSEEFRLDSEMVQTLWEMLDGQILSTDNYLQKQKDFTAEGVRTWCGVVRDIFGIGLENFQIITD